jgi:transcriptional regulator with XRE-family HTH domain
MSIKKTKGDASSFLRKLTGGPVTLGKLLLAIRLGEEMTQPEFARKLGISKSHINDIEKGRKMVSPERAAKFAKVLGFSEERFVELALQAILDEAGLKLKVDVEVA